MPSWREMAALEPVENRAAPTPAEDYGLEPGLIADLRRLRMMAPPDAIDSVANWRSVVSDALGIARDGWAAKALALGWSIGDLYGIGPRDSWDFEGLAVWLRGRRIIMLDSAVAIVAGDPDDYRSAFVRGGMHHGTHPTIVPVMLWEFGP